MKSLRDNLFMLKYMYKYCPSQILIYIFLAIYENIINIIGIFLLRYIIDSLMGNIEVNKVFIYAFLFLAMQIILISIQQWLAQFIVPKNLQMLSKGIQNELFKKASRIDYVCYENTEFYNDFSIAMQQADSRTIDVMNTFSSFISSIFGITSFTIVITYFEPILLLIVVVNVFISLIFTSKINKIQHNYYEERMPYARTAGYTQRVFYFPIFAKEIRLFKDFPDLIINKYNKVIQKMLYLIPVYGKKFFKLSIIQIILSNISQLISYFYIMFKVLEGVLKVSDFFTLTSSVSQLTMQITHLFEVIPSLKNNSLYIRNYRKFIDYECGYNKNSKDLKYTSGDIEFLNVSFRYSPYGKYVLKNISFKIKKGSKIAIVGKNGSGKTTIVKLLTHLYEINEGEIFLDNRNLEDYDVYSVRENIDVIFQDYQIFSISIIENVLMREVIDCKKDENITRQALIKVGLYDKVKDLPKGMYTNITKEFDNEGIFLSGGELQKLAIARIYAKESDIIILDEPSSSLDPIAEYNIFKQINKLFKNKTMIMISHRLTNVINADDILFIDDGRVIEEGTHDELMDLNGKYAEMFNIQCEKIMGKKERSFYGT